MDYSAKIKHWDDINVGDVETFTKTLILPFHFHQIKPGHQLK